MSKGFNLPDDCGPNTPGAPWAEQPIESWDEAPESDEPWLTAEEANAEVVRLRKENSEQATVIRDLLLDAASLRGQLAYLISFARSKGILPAVVE